MHVQLFSSGVLNQWIVTHKLDSCLIVLISSDLLKDWRLTHKLDASSAILISRGSDQRTHLLNAGSAILISGSCLLKHRRVTHRLDACSDILINDSNLLNHWEVNSLAGWMFNHLVSSSDLLKHWTVTYLLDECLAILISSSNLLNKNSQPGCISHSNLIQTMERNSLPRYITNPQWVKFMFTIYNLTDLSFRKLLSGFNNLHQEMPHTYYQYSISLIFMVIQQDIALTF